MRPLLALSTMLLYLSVSLFAQTANPVIKQFAGASGTAGTSGTGINRIQHIVFIIQENRTFDNYFGAFPGANGATSGKISTGQTIPLIHESDRTPKDLQHGWAAAHHGMDQGKMDAFDQIAGGNNHGDYEA